MSEDKEHTADVIKKDTNVFQQVKWWAAGFLKACPHSRTDADKHQHDMTRTLPTEDGILGSVRDLEKNLFICPLEL